MKKLIILITLCVFFNLSWAAPALRYARIVQQLAPAAIALAQHTDKIGVYTEGVLVLRGSGAIA